MPRPLKYATDEERAAARRRQHAAYEKRQRALERAERAQRTSPHPGGVHPVRVPPKVRAERERRGALAPRDLTALLMGDPKPGYSALDAEGAKGTKIDRNRQMVAPVVR